MSKLKLLQSSMTALKGVRSACLSFEDTLSRAVHEDSDGGSNITDDEMISLEWKLGNLVNQAERTRIILDEAIRKYESNRKYCEGVH